MSNYNFSNSMLARDEHFKDSIDNNNNDNWTSVLCSVYLLVIWSCVFHLIQ